MSQKKKAEQIEIKKSLIRGYLEMAEINLSLANMCIAADNEALVCCEEKMTECE